MKAELTVEFGVHSPPHHEGHDEVERPGDEVAVNADFSVELATDVRHQCLEQIGDRRGAGSDA